MWKVPLVMLAPLLVVAACAKDDVDGDAELRHRLLSDAELACLEAFGRDRRCLGDAAAGTPESACPAGLAASWYDAFGPDCVRAQIVLWSCRAELECGSTDSCGVEAEAAATRCAEPADGG